MSKVLLVEDDNNLREIFEMRLQAEGYQTLSASDGEEALAVATKEKPALIIADVMMPKLSGFEMLETLRAAPEMNNTKVIMMTALGQAEDRARGEKLGVVKYLVKSQVTLEDFVRVVREVLPPDGQAQGSTDAADAPKAQDSSSTNKLESEQTMQDDNTKPAMPADDQSGDANPVTGGSAMPSGDSMGGGASADNTPMDPPADTGPVSPPAEGPQQPVEEPRPEGGSPTPPPSGV